jgi:7-cyano-7-deazaguanine reductase
MYSGPLCRFGAFAISAQATAAATSLFAIYFSAAILTCSGQSKRVAGQCRTALAVCARQRRTASRSQIGTQSGANESNASRRVDRKRLRYTLSAVAKRKRVDTFRLLGHSDVKVPCSPAEAWLETFPNPAPRRNYHIHFETDDFTSVCPVTGQPDFARIDIDYVPDRLCVESKSLKFYLASYRNERAFNEAVTNRILDDFVKACAPREAIVTAQFSARGGIALTVLAEYPDRKSGRDNK